jgi:glycosyltransferase involved in cell wall biosynthesis
VVHETEKLLNELGVRQAVLFVSFPIWFEAARLLRDAFRFPLVYDCHDYLAGFQNVASDIVGMETRMLEACDLVIFSSEHLMETTTARFPQVREKSLLARNGVDPVQFHAEHNSAADVAGYVGSLDHWFDVASVERAARDHPDWTFRLIGRIEDPRVERLRECPNVDLTGEIRHADLPAQMASFRAGLIPFLRTPLTMAANPIKLYEYFGLGLPVVSVSLPEVENYRDLVYLADSPCAFSGQLARALVEDDPALRARRVAIAERESWRSRATQLLEAFRALSCGGRCTLM